jgi:REP element-mobilizing transposase RayT
MARPLRIEYPGAHYYLTARADRRDVLFRDDADYWRFLALLGVVCDRYGYRCYAYCLLPTRYVLVLSTREPNLAHGVRQLNGVYSQAYNRRHLLNGHLFAGRYQAIPFARDSHLLRACREVLRLPVTSGQVIAPEQWRWSSYQATLGTSGVRARHWLAIEDVLRAVPAAGVAVQEALRRYLSLPAAERLFSSAQPVAAILQDTGFLPCGWSRSDPEIPRRERVRVPPLTAVVANIPDRKTAMRHAYATGHYSLKQIAAHFGVHYATVSRAVGRSLG